MKFRNQSIPGRRLLCFILLLLGLLKAEILAGVDDTDKHKAALEEKASEALEKVILAFDDSDLSRKAILSQMQNVAGIYLETEYGKQALKMAMILQKMVAEDEAYQPKNLAKMTKQERIAHWIFMLRDQNGRLVWCIPQTDFFGIRLGWDNEPANGNTPAHELLALGYDAVQQLIAALDDNRFTRFMEFTKFSHHVLRVGDGTAAILEQLAGRTFCPSRYGVMHRDGGVGATKKKAQAWWREFQKKGEKQMLIEGTAAGDRDSWTQARRLIKKYAGDAFEPLVQGIRNGKEEWIRSILMIHLDKMKDPRVVQVFREELKGPFLFTRVQAATALFARQLDDGLPVLIREWEKGEKRRDSTDTFDCGTESLISALAGCSKVEAIQTLGRQWKKTPWRQRYQIVEAVGAVKEDYYSIALTAPVKTAMEALLIAALEDHDKFSGLFTVRRGAKQITNPRICDFAAKRLAKLWNQPELFDFFGELENRNRQLVAMKNVWQKKQAKAPLPAPK